MQEYEDDFFFEEDKIVDSIIKGTEDDPTADCILNDLRQERYSLVYQNLLGMTITSGSVSLLKDEKNLIGISIGGGAPLCPCLYIVQVFDNTPASSDGTLQCGDELVGVNGQSVKGKTKVEVAKMIQAATNEVIVNYNKLHADPVQGKSLDIVMKKVKHRLVENMSTSTADALGLSRAILSKDMLVVKLKELQATEQMYKGLVDHTKRMLKAYFDLLQTYKNFGDIFAAIGVREPQPRASEAFSKFGSYHRELDKNGIRMIKTLKPIIADMGTYLNKAIPDTKLTISKYADVKFEYLSYCLKVKEMDDEEVSFSSMQEPLYRVETGNYEYRLILRCRQDARARFAQLRSDVMVKLELLDNKHIQDLAQQLQKILTGQSTFHDGTYELLKEHSSLFPVEVDLSQNAFQYKSAMPIFQDHSDEFDEISLEATEDLGRKRLIKSEKGDQSESLKLLPDLDDSKTVNPLDIECTTESTSLLAELGLDNIMPLTLNPTSSAITQPDLEFCEFMSNIGDNKKSDSMTNLLSGF